ncbi:DUF3054 domain-containing protein [Salinirubellus sp. GCM10025818]|uniref:DUF3054 domain-containing protein n=1 Tax=Salinirubellus TaxID=2162630 RepID=UPI0030D22FA2
MSTGTDTALGGRVELSPLTAAIAGVDVLLLLTFVVLGEFSHFGVTPTAFARAPGTAAPFLLGWVVLAPLVGVYAPAARRSARAAAVRTAAAWVGTVAVAQTLRSTAAFPGDFAVAFAVVSLLVGLALLLPWRVLVASRLS